MENTERSLNVYSCSSVSSMRQTVTNTRGKVPSPPPRGIPTGTSRAPLPSPGPPACPCPVDGTLKLGEDEEWASSSLGQETRILCLWLMGKSALSWETEWTPEKQE